MNNIAESDSDIDTVEEVQEIVTSDLKGDKIERLLYKAGLDSEHKLGDEGITVLEIRGDSLTIVMSETWEADGQWFIDPSAIVLDVFEGDRFFRSYFPEDLETEEELVEFIEQVVDNGVLW